MIAADRVNLNRLSVMAMVDQFTKDMFLLVDGALSVVVDRQYKTQGRLGGLIILKLKNVESGQTTSLTVKAGTKFEQVTPEYKEVQYLYQDETNAYFMDTESYETLSVAMNLIDDYAPYLKEGDKNVVMFYEGKAVSIRRNVTVDLEVTEAADAVKGNTSGNATKIVTTETGYQVAVPLFINKGDVITVNTESGQYSGRR